MSAADALLKTQCLINGQWRDADNGRTIAVTNPANGATIAAVPDMGAAEALVAVAAAHAAQKDWAARSPKPKAKPPTVHPMSNGMPKKPSACTATPSPPSTQASASPLSASPSACVPRLPRGTSPTP